jgi:cyclophilin family peptidyl-prolyl cis-trans isomerase
VQALRRIAGRGADSVYLAQLALDDSQLIMAAVAALDSTTNPRAAPTMLDALDRLTSQRRETSRDARVPLLAGIRRHGSPALRQRIEPYLSDFDPRVAALAADILGEWTGVRREPRPSAPPPLPLPTFADADALANTTFVLEMEEGGTIEIRLMPFLAPTNAARFARLARAGYFDGLTFHRIAPNFVIQGGSPGANEYAGDGPFTRDELGGGNWRGTVGLSTRGRDTGDAQIYINTIDNVRLDHDYTVFGIVMAGMDVVDRLQEGARIGRVTERRQALRPPT